MQPRLTTIHLESNTLRTEALQYLIQQLEIKKVSTLECLRIRGKYKVKIANSLLKKLKKKIEKIFLEMDRQFLGVSGAFLSDSGAEARCVPQPKDIGPRQLPHPRQGGKCSLVCTSQGILQRAS